MNNQHGVRANLVPFFDIFHANDHPLCERFKRRPAILHYYQIIERAALNTQSAFSHFLISINVEFGAKPAT